MIGRLVRVRFGAGICFDAKMQSSSVAAGLSRACRTLVRRRASCPTTSTSPAAAPSPSLRLTPPRRLLVTSAAGQDDASGSAELVEDIVAMPPPPPSDASTSDGSGGKKSGGKAKGQGKGKRELGDALAEVRELLLDPTKMVRAVAGRAFTPLPFLVSTLVRECKPLHGSSLQILALTGLNLS